LAKVVLIWVVVYPEDMYRREVEAARVVLI
jgi:hypothetical protein